MKENLRVSFRVTGRTPKMFALFSDMRHEITDIDAYQLNLRNIDRLKASGKYRTDYDSICLQDSAKLISFEQTDGNTRLEFYVETWGELPTSLFRALTAEGLKVDKIYSLDVTQKRAGEGSVQESESEFSIFFSQFPLSERLPEDTFIKEKLFYNA